MSKLHEFGNHTTNLFTNMPLRTVLLSLAGFLASLTLCSAASPIMLGENSTLNLRASGAVQYNDNIFLDSVAPESDVIWVFSPGVELNFGQKPSNAHVNLVYVHDFLRYAGESQLNRDSPDLKVNGRLQSVKSNIDFGVSYKENSQNDASNNLTGDLARRNIFRAHVDGEWSMTAKS